MPVDVLVSPGRLIQWTTDLKLNHIKYEVIIDDVPEKIKAQRLPAESNRLTVGSFEYSKYNTYEDASSFSYILSVYWNNGIYFFDNIMMSRGPTFLSKK